MVDMATLRRVAIATDGSRGDVVTTTSDGRLLVSQSNQVDVVAPATAPTVVATNPPADAQIALPQPFLSNTFDQDMFVADARSEEHTSELQSLMRLSYDVFCLKTQNARTHAG